MGVKITERESDVIPVAAVMLVKNEEDVIEYTIRHLLGHVNHIIVADNGSTDRTREILEAYPIAVVDDDVIGYYQAKKTSHLALRAFREGFDWVLPCDADELWYAPEGRLIRDYLDGVPPDVRAVQGALYNHLPTGEDDPNEPNPFVRIRWRQRQPAPIGKICVRTGVDLQIHQGNHGATFEGHGVTAPGLMLRHFSWRSPKQYLAKIRTGSAAYAATELDPSVGAHWRMFDDADDQAILDHYHRWFHYDDPGVTAALVFDPAPYADGSILAAKVGETIT